MIGKMIQWWSGGAIRTSLGRPISPMGRLLWALGMVDILQDGDGITPRFRWWNPLCWLLWLCMIPVCAFVGEKITEAVPFRVSAYWRDKPQEIKWVTGWPQKDQRKPY